MRGSPSYGGDDGFFSHRHGRRAVESRSHWGSLDFRGTKLAYSPSISTSTASPSWRNPSRIVRSSVSRRDDGVAGPGLNFEGRLHPCAGSREGKDRHLNHVAHLVRRYVANAQANSRDPLDRLLGHGRGKRPIDPLAASLVVVPHRWCWSSWSCGCTVSTEEFFARRPRLHEVHARLELHFVRQNVIVDPKDRVRCIPSSSERDTEDSLPHAANDAVAQNLLGAELRRCGCRAK